MKKIYIISLCLVLVLCLCACGKKSSQANTESQPSAQQTTEKKYSESWMNDAASEDMKKYTQFFRFADTWDMLYAYKEYDPKNAAKEPFGDGYFTYNQEIYDNMLETLVEKFKTEKTKHPFAKKFIDEFNKTNYTELSDIEKLTFECYAKILFGDAESTTDFFKYDSSNISFELSDIDINTIDRLVRAFTENDNGNIQLHLYFAENDTKATRYFLRILNGERKIRNQYYENKDISLPVQVQTELDVEVLKKIINDNIEFFDFLVQYRDNVYAEIREGEEYTKYIETKNSLPKSKKSEDTKNQYQTSTSKKEPAIGMTKSELINSTWGYPKNKNISEYAWGTEEQWVYPSRGYVYLTNGIVTSIQHRE